MKIILACVLVMAVATPPSVAQIYRVMRAGAYPCSTLTVPQDKQWVLGFLSGAGWEGKKNPLLELGDALAVSIVRRTRSTT